MAEGNLWKLFEIVLSAFLVGIVLAIPFVGISVGLALGELGIGGQLLDAVSTAPAAAIAGLLIQIAVARVYIENRPPDGNPQPDTAPQNHPQGGWQDQQGGQQPGRQAGGDQQGAANRQSSGGRQDTRGQQDEWLVARRREGFWLVNCLVVGFRDTRPVLPVYSGIWPNRDTCGYRNLRTASASSGPVAAPTTGGPRRLVVAGHRS